MNHGQVLWHFIKQETSRFQGLPITNPMLEQIRLAIWMECRTHRLLADWITLEQISIHTKDSELFIIFSADAITKMRELGLIPTHDVVLQ